MCREDYILHISNENRIMFKALFEGVVSWFYPPHCPVCKKLLPSGEGRMCADCRSKLQYCEEPLCARCGRPVWNYYVEFCDNCAGRRFEFDKGFVLFQYDSLTRKLISDFKFCKKAEYADFLAEELAERYGKLLINIKADLLVPVPIHKSRHKERGYNQAKLLADRLGLFTGIRSTELLKRVKKTRPQKELTTEERRINLQHAFELCRGQLDRLKKEGICPKTVVLIDDIYTTGTTLNECAGVLKAGGIQRVYFISLSAGNVV